MSVTPQIRRNFCEVCIPILPDSAGVPAGGSAGNILPLPVPASVYGLVLMLAALKLGILRLEQVKEAGAFLISILPLLFIPAAAGVMELWTELEAMLLPCLIAVIPVTLLVMGVSGRVAQRVRRMLDTGMNQNG